MYFTVSVIKKKQTKLLGPKYCEYLVWLNSKSLPEIGGWEKNVLVNSSMLQIFPENYPFQNGTCHVTPFIRLYLGWDSVKVLPQHPPHVLASVWGHLVLEQEGELATLADAVEVAVDLIVLTTCKKKTVTAVNSLTANEFVFFLLRECAQPDIISIRMKQSYETQR